MNYIQQLVTDLKNCLIETDSYMSDCDDLIELYALLTFVKGDLTTLKDVHDAWAIWRNRTKPDHKSLVEFDELTLEVQELDRKYMECIHVTAKKFNL